MEFARWGSVCEAERGNGRWAKERQKGNQVDRSEASELDRNERSVCETEQGNGRWAKEEPVASRCQL